MFNRQYNFRYNSSEKGYKATSKVANALTSIKRKISIRRYSESIISTNKSSARGILKLEPRVVRSTEINAKSRVNAFVAIMYYAKPDLDIFDRFDKRLATMSNEGVNACPFWDALYREELNKGGTFEFTVPANHDDSQYIVAENKVAFRDKDNNFRLFVIKETEEIDGADGPIIEAYCEPEYIDELNDVVIEDKRPQDRTAEYALGQVLENSRWQAGDVAELGTNTTNFYFETAIEAINKILDTWGGEIRDRIEVDGNKITGRYIDILTRRGADTGKRWEIDKDIIEIARVTDSYPKTALYGRGASLETEGGGYSRKLTFEEVEWSVEDGDPVDKPKGQKWVGDMDALQHYGRRMIGGRNLLLDTPGEEVEGIEFRSWNSDYYIVTDSVIDEIKKGGTYTMSVYYTHTESNNDSRFGLIFQFYTDSGFYSQYYSYDTFIESGETGWSKCTFELPDVSDIDEITGARVYIRSDNNVGSEESGKFVKYKMTKLEKGNKATDWSPAPEDVINDASYHRMGIYENGNIEDPEELLWATWNELQEQKRPFENFELDVTLYAEKAGLDHERVRLGDTTVAIDRRFARPIEVEERVIAFEYDVANPDDVGKVEFGQFRDLFSDDERLDKIQAQLDSAQGKANEPIDDDRYPDVKPPTPENFTAEGLFKAIQLKWDFNASSYIASYELYASQTPNFNPTSDRLVWRGKTGGYAFEADTDEQWYFRLRAVNTHGTASDFTDEVSASTIKIDAGYDVEPLTITDELIAHDAKIDFAKIANVEITDAEIANLSGDKIKAGKIVDEDGNIEFNLDDGVLNIKNGAINIERPDGAVWVADGMVNKEYDVVGQDPPFADPAESASPHDPFSNVEIAGYYFGRTSVIAGTDGFSNDIRDPEKGYTINRQRYWFIHSARYFVLRFQPSVQSKGVEKFRVRLYEDDDRLVGDDIDENDFGFWYPLIVDLGTPTFEERRIDLRVGFLKQWMYDHNEGIAYRISRVYLTDVNPN